MSEFKAPGRLRLLLRVLGGWWYAVLVTFGWQPEDEQEDRRPPPNV